MCVTEPIGGRAVEVTCLEKMMNIVHIGTTVLVGQLSTAGHSSLR